MLELVDRLCDFGDRQALVVDGERLTYKELHNCTQDTMALLATYGVTRGSRVGLLMPNSVKMITALLALWRLGAMVLPINTRYRADELKFVLSDSKIDLLLTSHPAPGGPDLRVRICEALGIEHLQGYSSLDVDLRAAPKLRKIVQIPREMPTGLIGKGNSNHSVAANDELLMVYTTGTTSRPKGCIHHLPTFVGTARATADIMQMEGGDVLWNPLPLFHTGGLLPLLGALDRGATFCTSEHFNAEAALKLIESERVTIAHPAFSTLVTALLDSADFERRNLSSLRWILVVGPRKLLTRVQNEIPAATQVSGYGCTEIGGVLVYNRIEDSALERSTTTGRPFDGVVLSILDPGTGEELEDGTVGEIAVSAPSLLRRYHGEVTPPVDTRGRFHTGDLGRITANGALSFEGRLKDMLKVGGENVSAAEVEQVLVEHPSVTLAAVVAAPDDRLDEVPVAFVELKPHREVDEAQLIRFCSERLASFKVPRYVRLVTSWPMSATKIQKYRLREQFLLESRKSNHSRVGY